LAVLLRIQPPAELRDTGCYAPVASCDAETLIFVNVLGLALCLVAILVYTLGLLLASEVMILLYIVLDDSNVGKVYIVVATVVVDVSFIRLLVASASV